MNVLITGANRGLGKVAASILSAEGHTVLMGSRSLDNAIASIADIRKSESDISIFPIEIDMNSTDFSGVKKDIEDVVSHLDVIIHNAGIFPNYDGADIVDIQNIRSTMAVNVYGPLLLSQSLLPLFKGSGHKRIVHVSSQMGDIREQAGSATAYRLSKAALNGLTVFMSTDLAPQGISVVSVCPGWCRTDMGGGEAPRSSEQGARSIIHAALAEDIESGSFYRDGEKIGF